MTSQIYVIFVLGQVTVLADPQPSVANIRLQFKLLEEHSNKLTSFDALGEEFI